MSQLLSSAGQRLRKSRGHCLQPKCHQNERDSPFVSQNNNSQNKHLHTKTIVINFNNWFVWIIKLIWFTTHQSHVQRCALRFFLFLKSTSAHVRPPMASRSSLLLNLWGKNTPSLPQHQPTVETRAAQLHRSFANAEWTWKQEKQE